MKFLEQKWFWYMSSEFKSNISHLVASDYLKYHWSQNLFWISALPLGTIYTGQYHQWLVGKYFSRLWKILNATFVNSDGYKPIYITAVFILPAWNYKCCCIHTGVSFNVKETVDKKHYLSDCKLSSKNDFWFWQQNVFICSLSLPYLPSIVS